jgi:hypothetical protein
MPSLDQHQSTTTTKLLLIGDSGAGKTASLTSLVEAGYKLRILDFDNGLDSLVGQIRRRCSDKARNVSYETLRDKYRGSGTGVVLDGPPKAFVTAMQLLDKWSDGTKPGEWGSDTVLVVDSLTFMSQCAFNYAQYLNPSAKDKRTIFYGAQESIEHTLALLTSESFKPNVIVIAHMTFLNRPDGTTKAFPVAVGQALSPKISPYFNSVALAESTGSGQGLKRVIRTVTTPLIDLKNPASFELAETLPIDSALATFFTTVQGGANSKLKAVK